VTNDDLLFRHRLRLFARAGEVGVSQACRELHYHRSSYYRWKDRVDREGEGRQNGIRIRGWAGGAFGRRYPPGCFG
jgi:hypothetical protein